MYYFFLVGATFVDKFLNLSGNIENLDLNTIVDQNSKQLLKIEDKIFQNHLNVNGTLSINKNVNGIELKKFCTFSEPNEKLQTLKIKGNVLFSKGPKILNFNGESVKGLMKNVWFSDVAANISASVHLKNVTFNKSLNVSAFVDSINLDLLSENYLSKSKNQIISSSIAFSNVTFLNISTPSLKYMGPINGIVIEDILKRVLIQGEPQIFERTGYFEEVLVQNLIEDAEYTVNNLSFNTDIMRYDQQNIVTGQKTFENLRVETLNLTHNVKIQKVDILDWLSNAVLTKGVIRVKEKKSFDRATFSQGLSLRGKFNGEDFTEENIMLVNMPQNITGKKIFSKSTQFKTLMVKGLVNNIDIEKLVQNQTNRHENSTINSEIIFDNDVEAKNINVDILYDDINVTQLIANVTKLRNLDSLKGKFRDLLNMGMEIEGYLKNHAKLFKYYKEIIQFPAVDDIFGLKCDDGIFRIVVFCVASNQFKTFEWDAEKGTFVFSGVIFKSPSKPNFMQQVTLGDRAYLYIENPLQNHNELHSGRLIKVLSPTTFEIVAEFHRTATISLISFVNFARQGCLGFIGNSLSGIDILCDENGYNYYWSQRIRLEGAYKATTLETPDSVYLFVTRYGRAFKEPSIVIFQSGKDTSDFIEIQTIFERTSPNGLATAFISNCPFVALSFGSQEETVDSGWISIKKLDNNQFIDWQHIPLTTPQNVHFINQPSFEPLILVPSADVSAPLHTFQYDGAAGFKEISKGSSLPVSSKIKILGNGHFLATLQHTRGTGTILGAVVL
ncbi:unnamed protein product [Ceutorhynchus assimilis]|uniref:Uncharacterized protein n=1 Tax=Ceutorhynchus assimilis TaxID=467358 RepID=A0A9N9MHA5_9CUCU|nr:unnamed protein product [Ceutorhynchus assimilis]